MTKIWLNARSNFVDNKHFCTNSRLNPESFKCNFNGLKKFNLKKYIKNGVGAVFAGQAGTITSFIFYEALAAYAKNVSAR